MHKSPVKKIHEPILLVWPPTSQTWNFKLISQLFDHNGDWNVVLNKLLTRERSPKWSIWRSTLLTTVLKLYVSCQTCNICHQMAFTFPNCFADAREEVLKDCHYVQQLLWLVSSQQYPIRGISTTYFKFYYALLISCIIRTMYRINKSSFMHPANQLHFINHEKHCNIGRSQRFDSLPFCHILLIT